MEIIDLIFHILPETLSEMWVEIKLWNFRITKVPESD